MRLYVCGPMTGMVDHNFPAFKQAAAELLDAGYEVENPADFGTVDGWAWEDYLKRDIPLMLECQGLALLPGWHLSEGANLERYIATALGLKSKPVGWWLQQ